MAETINQEQQEMASKLPDSGSQAVDNLSSVSPSNPAQVDDIAKKGVDNPG